MLHFHIAPAHQSHLFRSFGEFKPVYLVCTERCVYSEDKLWLYISAAMKGVVTTQTVSSIAGMKAFYFQLTLQFFAVYLHWIGLISHA